MRLNLIVTAIVIASLVGVGLALMCGRTSPPSPTARDPLPQPATRDALPQPDEAVDTLGFSGDFWRWPAARQEAWLTTAGTDQSWSSGMRTFMLAAVRDHRLTPLARNNVACGLLAQENPFPELVDSFVRMSQDETEQLAWRHYALQFAALSGGDRADVRAELVAVLDQRDGRAGTAALQLQRLAIRGCEMPSNFADSIAAIAGDGTRLVQDRVAAMGILSERHDPRCVPIARGLIAHGSSALRRSAVSSLGALGTKDDMRPLESARNDADESVADIARQALARLMAREDSPSIQ